MSNRRGARLTKKLTVRSERPRSVKGRVCSDRIIQLALPNLHIVSSVLKEHFEKLSKEHVDRLEKLMEQIKTTRVSISPTNFMDVFQRFGESEKRKIIEVLDEVHRNKSVQQLSPEWKQAKFLPVKSSSDTFLITLNKPSMFSHTKRENSSIDSSFGSDTYKNIFKKAVEAMNCNYKETILIKLEGIQNSIRSCTEEKPKTEKSVQTDSCKTEISKSHTGDVDVLFVQTKNVCKRKKLRQLHTLLEPNNYIERPINNECNAIKYDKSNQTQLHTLLEPNNYIERPINNECNAIKYDKSNQTFHDNYELSEDVKITIDHLCRLYVVIREYADVFWSIVKNAFVVISRTAYDVTFTSLPIILLEIYVESIKNAEKLYNKAKTYCIEKSHELSTGSVKKEYSNRRKKKLYYNKTYHFTNISSILH
ncbi:hypothetical protein QE152_g10989 [Popillia japonica]|uniref:Uncharacterized protein n=1 Tax=Popillia japonica TaxID=7064 RepID=A0AAW1LNY6_POPJA